MQTVAGPKTKQQQRQEKRLSRSIGQAKARGKDQSGVPADRKKPNGPPVKKTGGFFSSLTRKIFGRKDKPQTAQQSIPYIEMYRDGVCRVNDRLYTKTIVELRSPVICQ